MGLLDRIFGRRSSEATTLTPRHGQGDAATTSGVAPQPAPDERWYVPHDGNRDRFVGSNGIPPLHLIPYRDFQGESVLRLCEDATGLLIGPTDNRLARAGVYVSQLRGEAYHREACRAGDFHPGRPVRLVREPANEFDPNAVAVYDDTGKHMAAYVNKQKARTLARLLDSGEPIEAVSIRGTGSGVPCDQVAILAASPEVLRRLLEPRPAHLPPLVHQGR
ncbi:HIRAN domain-containing protein [Couchioplanes azureus]|uniref:HIRAN domain-containing protein n=1 Tax=Couchioplanes caeruleus TaxID=56438 RepID=UPI001670E588|nr:hypothetical protein GCM10010166_66900 [Couchioplanes caeruleus subsp. azureus]